MVKNDSYYSKLFGIEVPSQELRSKYFITKNILFVGSCRVTVLINELSVFIGYILALLNGVAVSRQKRPDAISPEGFRSVATF